MFKNLIKDHKPLLIVDCISAVVIIIALSIYVSDRNLLSALSISYPQNNQALSYSIDPSFFDVADQDVVSSVDVPDKEVITESVAPRPDVITAKAYIIGDISTGVIYADKNPDMVLPVASMSKLITAFIVKDELDPSLPIIIPPDVTDLPPDGSDLVPGESFSLEEILYPLLLNSSNLTAESIARSVDRGYFLRQMSAYAWEVGMPASFFDDPSGLSPQNIASARDIFALARYLYDFRPDILAITRIPNISISTTTEHGYHEFTNTHPFVDDYRFVGGKTGRTLEAGETMMTVLEINNRPIVFIVLGSLYGQRAGDTNKLIERFKTLANSL